jgi:uncharacterized Zn-finger protein
LQAVRPPYRIPCIYLTREIGAKQHIDCPYEASAV